MKKFFGGFLLLGLTFMGAFYIGKTRCPPIVPSASSLVLAPSPYTLVNHPFVIVIVGFNNGAWLEKTLDSAVRQNYSNFRIVYIDDASDDGSFDLAQDVVQGRNLVTLVRNETRLGVLPNLAAVIASCGVQEIVVILGGEDWLAHEWVLSRLNQYYANPDLWMTYGRCLEYPSYCLGPSKAKDPTLAIRQQPFFASHLHSFYADLFQHIAPEDLGYFAAAEQAYMLPMLEMAGAHGACISDILYIANTLRSKDNLEMAALCEKSIRSLGAYAPIIKRPHEFVEEGTE